jgi:membrane dipeptidase
MPSRFVSVRLLSSLLAATAAFAQTPATSTGADAALRERALAIHARVLTLDTHKDIDPLFAPEQLPSDPATREEFVRRLDPGVRGTQQVDLVKMREGQLDCAFHIVYVGQGRLAPDAFHKAHKEAIAKFDAIDRMVARYGDRIGLATSPDEVERLHRDGKLIASIGIENGYPMGLDLGNIEKFFHRGARYMSIAHNGHNQLGDSHTPAEPRHGGLSELGRQAVAEMNRLGIMVDVSHASRATMLEVVQRSRAPVIASHSGARAVCDHTRNLDDEQLRAIAKNRGVVQAVALGAFVKAKADGEPDADVRDFVDHIDHIVKVAGIDHVGIASDFDGGGGIVGWNDASETPNVTIELVRRGYSEAQIGKIWSGNLLRVWREVEAAAQTKSTPPGR